MIHDQSESIILQKMQTGSKDKKHKSKERSYSHKKRQKKVLPPISTFSEAVDEVNFDPTASGRLFSAVQNIIGR